MSRTTLVGYQRETGSNRKLATPSVGLQAIQFDLDPTAASADTGKTLPKGCLPLFVQNIDGGATGGTNPTIDVGVSGTPNGFADELDADLAAGLISGGSLIGTELTVNTAIFAGVGASAATGGTVKVAVYYIMVDDGSF